MPQDNNVGMQAVEALFGKHLPWLDSATLSLPDDGYTNSFIVTEKSSTCEQSWHYSRRGLMLNL